MILCGWWLVVLRRGWWLVLVAVFGLVRRGLFGVVYVDLVVVCGLRCLLGGLLGFVQCLICLDLVVFCGVGVIYILGGFLVVLVSGVGFAVCAWFMVSGFVFVWWLSWVNLWVRLASFWSLVIGVALLWFWVWLVV